MDEAKKLSQRMLLLSHGKIVIEGEPRRIIEEKVKKFALEIREVDLVEPQTKNPKILFQKRGNAHLYFADGAEELTYLINFYGNRQIILRPSNLEDVFLRMIDS